MEIPKEIQDKIDEKADEYGFVVPYDGSNKFYKEDKVKGFQDGGAFGYSLAAKELEAKDNKIFKLERDLKASKSLNEQFAGFVEAKEKEITIKNEDIKMLKQTVSAKIEEIARLEGLLKTAFQDLEMDENMYNDWSKQTSHKLILEAMEAYAAQTLSGCRWVKASEEILPEKNKTIVVKTKDASGKQIYCIGLIEDYAGEVRFKYDGEDSGGCLIKFFLPFEFLDETDQSTPSSNEGAEKLKK